MQRFVYLSSNDPDIEKSDTGTFNIPFAVPMRRVHKIDLVSLSFVNTVFNVSKDRNVVVLNGEVHAIPEGNYDVRRFVSVLQNLLQGKANVTTDDITASLVLQSVTPQPFVINFDSTAFTLPREFMGWPYNFSDAVSGFDLKSPGIMDLMALHRNVIIDFENLPSGIKTPSQNIEGHFMFSLDSVKGAVSVLYGETAQSIELNPPRDIQFLKMRLINLRNQVLDFNAASWSLLLSVHSVN